MNQRADHNYEFGPFRLDAEERLLLRDGESVPLTPKAFDLLLALIEKHGHLLGKEELLKLVWPDTFVEEANLSYNISLIRKALGEGENGQRYIETVPKRGYRFVAGVRKVAEENEESGGAEQVRPPAFNEERPPAAKGRETAEAPVASTEDWMSRIKRHKRAVIVALAILIMAGAGAIYLAPLIRRTFQAEQPPPQRKLWQLTFDAGLQSEPTWSPDGRFIAYSADRGGNFDIWVQPAGEGNPVQVTTSPATIGSRTGRLMGRASCSALSATGVGSLWCRQPAGPNARSPGSATARAGRRMAPRFFSIGVSVPS